MPADSVLYHSWPEPGGVRVEYLSGGAEELLEVPAAELGRLFNAGTLPLYGVDEAAFYRAAEESLVHLTAWRAEFGWVGPRTGTRRWLRAADFPRHTPAGVPYFVGVISDLTEARRFESLGVLAGGIAHDFNNLLTVILGNAAVARLAVPPGSAVAGSLVEVENACRRAADLCGQLTAYAGVGRPAVGQVDVADLLRQPVLAAPPPPPVRRGGVLVCDDEGNVRELIASVLEDDGFTVFRAKDVPDGAAVFAAAPAGFVLAVVDVMMPGGSGHDLLRRLRQQRPGLPAVIVSGFSDRELPPDLTASGPTAMLPKPFRLEELSAVVNGVLG